MDVEFVDGAKKGQAANFAKAAKFEACPFFAD